MKTLKNLKNSLRRWHFLRTTNLKENIPQTEWWSEQCGMSSYFQVLDHEQVPTTGDIESFEYV